MICHAFWFGILLVDLTRAQHTARSTQAPSWLPSAMSGRPYYLPAHVGSQEGWMCLCDSTFRREREFMRHKCRLKKGPWLIMWSPDDERRLRRKGAIFKDGGEDP